MSYRPGAPGRLTRLLDAVGDGGIVDDIAGGPGRLFGRQGG